MKSLIPLVPLALFALGGCDCNGGIGGGGDDGGTDVPAGSSCFADRSALLGSTEGGTVDLQAVDIDGDQDLDLVWASQSAGVIEVRRNTDGAFEAAVGAELPDVWTFVLPADLDADGDVDLVLTRPGPDAGALQALALSNDGSGRFTEAAGAVPPITGESDGLVFGRAAAGDLNQDGLTDLIVPVFSHYTETVYDQPNVLLMNQGGGSFARAEEGLLPEIPAYTDFTLSVAMGDVTGDGAIDVFLGEAQARQRLLVNANDGTGRLIDQSFDDGWQVPRLPAETLRAFRSEMRDVDQDGDQDVVIVGDATPGGEIFGAHLFRNQGEGYFERELLSRTDEPRDVRGVGFGDVNGDGWLDILLGQGTALSHHGRALEVWLGSEQGDFAEMRSVPEISKGVYAIASFDWSGDGLDDVVLGVNDPGAGGDDANILLQSVFEDCDDGTLPPEEPETPEGRFVQVTAGSEFSCGLKDDGSVTCWGNVVATPPPDAFAQISAGHQIACGVTTGGEGRCWGPEGSTILAVPAGAFEEISARHGWACGRRPGGTSSECWGGGEEGMADFQPPADVELAQLSTGWSHGCGVATDGSIRCWSFPIWATWDFVLPPEGAFSQVSAGNEDTCALQTDGTVVCFGRNVNGEGQPPETSFTQLSAGWYFTCGIAADASVLCWGLDDYGQTDTPPGSFTQVSTGYRHACAVSTDGAVVCWGDNRLGQADGAASSP